MRDYLNLSGLPLWTVFLLFGASALVILITGAKLTRVADRLADLTGIGEALFGAVLLGATTSLPGIVTSVYTASAGFAQLSVSNAVGGIAAQTAFLAVADITYRRANLEHAAASIENLVQAALLMTLLALPLLAIAGPEVSVWAIHPASPMLLASYVFGITLVKKSRSAPLWKPHTTRETRLDEPQEARIGGQGLWRLWLLFVLFAVMVAAAGWMVAQTGIAISERTGLSESVVGMLFTAIATSLPELVTAVAAVRQGALTLAVGDIIGGNSFDVLFIALSDVAYRQGSIYHAIADEQSFTIALALLLSGILLLGLLRREKSGIANIGFESFFVLLFYAGSVVLMFFWS